MATNVVSSIQSLFGYRYYEVKQISLKEEDPFTCTRDQLSSCLKFKYMDARDICIYRWVIDNKIIGIYRKKEDLIYKLFDTAQVEVIIRPINFGSDPPSIEERISLLSKCLPRLEQSGFVSFSNPLICHTWTVKNSRIFGTSQFIGDNKGVIRKITPQNVEKHELDLVWRPDEFLWCLFNIRNGLTICSSFDNRKADNPPSLKLSNETSNIINKELTEYPIESIVSLLQNFTVSKAHIYPFNKESLSVYLMPKIEKSHIDDRVLISQFQWAVSLITHNGSEGNHAHILVEGITNDSRFLLETDQKGYFMYQSHFTGSQVKSKPQNPSKLKYEERTPIWKVSSQKVVRMLEVIIFERDNELIPSFSRLGCDSIFSGGAHSCFTWAREYFKILDVDLGKSSLGWAFTRTKNYTRPKDEYSKLPIYLSCYHYDLI